MWVAPLGPMKKAEGRMKKAREPFVPGSRGVSATLAARPTSQSHHFECGMGNGRTSAWQECGVVRAELELGVPNESHSVAPFKLDWFV